MEIMKLAEEKAMEDLSEYTEYEDGTVDQPFLNYETIIDEKKTVEQNIPNDGSLS